MRSLAAALYALSLGFPALAETSSTDFASSLPRQIEFETSEGTRMNPDVSPDGKTLVFDLLGDLYLLDIGGGKARALTSGPAVDYRPRFSPDGSRIAFVSDRNGTDNLWVMHVDGTGAHMVSTQDARERPKTTRFFITPSWTPDGAFVAAAVTSELTFYGADDIRRFPADGAGDSHSVTKPPPLDPDTRPISTARRKAFPREGVDPEFSRDGRYLYYSVRTGLTRFNDEKLMPQYQVGLFDLHTEQLHTLTNAPQGAFTPRLSPDGRWLAYAVRYDGDTGLRLRDLESGAERWLVFPVERDAAENWWTEGVASAHSFLPDGSALVTSFGGKLWRVGVPDGVLTEIPFTARVRAELAPLGRPIRKISDDDAVRARHLSDHALSPDGRQLAFRALGRVWVMDWPDGRPRRLTRDEHGLDDEARPAWSADGRSVLFTATSAPGWEGHIYEARVGSGGPPRALTRVLAYYPSFAIVPGSGDIVALRTSLTRDNLFNGVRHAELVILPRDAGKERVLLPVSFESGSSLEGRTPPDLQFLPGDGTRVFYFDNDASTLVSVRLADGARREHVSVRGIGAATGTGGNQNIEVRRALLHPSGKSLLLHDNATAFGHIDLVDLSGVDLDAATPAATVRISGTAPDTAGAVRRLSGLGGGTSPFWSADGRSAFFAVADQVFQASPAGDAAAREVTRIDVSLQRPQSTAVLAFRGGRLLTMNRGAVIESGDLVVQGARIVALGPEGTVEIPAGARVIDARGMTLMPGLVSTHSHNSEAGELAPLPALAWPLQTKLAYGVTTMLDPAAPVELYTLADLTAAGQFAGPRIYSTGPIMTWNETLDSPDDARTLLARSRAYHDCCAKVYDIGGRLNRQWMWSAADAAQQLPVLETEGSLNVSLSYVLDGVGHLAHGLQMPVYDDVRQLLGRSGSSISYQFNTLVGNGGPSTLFWYFDHELDEGDARARQWTPYEYFQSANRRRLTVSKPEQVFHMYGENLAPLMDAGVPIHLGEHGVAHGLANHWTIWALASGAGNARALEAATIHGAYGLGLERELGSLEAGKLADLLVLEGNPLEDIRATMKIHQVMRGGELFDAMTLERIWPSPAPAPDRWWSRDEPAWRTGSRATAAGVR